MNCIFNGCPDTTCNRPVIAWLIIGKSQVRDHGEPVCAYHLAMVQGAKTNA